MLVADALSRQLCENHIDTLDTGVSIIVVQFTANKLVELCQPTREDGELQLLKHNIINGWPDKHTSISHQLHQYWAYRDDLVIEDALIMKGECIVIPHMMQREIVSHLT